MATDILSPEQTAPDGQPTLSPKGIPPKSKLPTAEAARSLLTGLIEADVPDSQQRTAIQAKIDGAPLYTDAQLKAANQGWRARGNWGGARARIRDYLTAFHDLVTSPDTLPVVTVRDGDPMQRAAWGQIFSEEFQATLFETQDDWSFLYHMEMHHRQLAIHGIGPCFWRDRRDWRFYAMKRRNILVPKDSPSDPSRLPIVFIRDCMYVDELFKFISVKDKPGSKWNQTATIEAIRNAQAKTVSTFSWEDAEERWKNNCFGWSRSESKVVNVAHAFVKEFDGRVSHHIFTETSSPEHKPKDGDNGYLYSEIGAFASLNEAVWVCFQDVGNGDFHGVRGLGMEAYHFGESQDQLNNALINNAMIGSAVLLKADTPERAENLTRMTIGPLTVVEPGVETMTINTGAAIQSTLAVANHFRQIESSNTGSYQTRATTPSNQARTATEISAEIGETSKLNNSMVSHYCAQGSNLLLPTFRRLTSPTVLPTDPGGKEALAFKQRCIERGIPADFFHELADGAKVTMARPVGNGSYADRIARLNSIGQFMGEMPDRKRRQYVRDVIAQTGGNRDLAERYGPDLEETPPGIESSIAILENNSYMGGGMQDPFSVDNAHAVHLPIHIQFLAAMLQFPDMQQAAQVAPELHGHAMQHLQAMEGDETRRREYDEFKAQLGELQNAIKQLIKMAEIQPQPEAPPDPEMVKIQGQLDIARTESEGRLQIESETARGKLELLAREKQVEAAIKDNSKAHEMATSARVTAHQMEMDKAKAANKPKE